MTTTGRAAGVRERARTQMRTEILDVARAQLAEHGAGALSLRAVARDVGMASSAVYRYFENRDALLTALIIDAYDSLGAAVEEAEALVPREDLLGRWRQIARTVRSWALEHPHLYALVYGSPVPGYAAPDDTIGPATRVTRLLADLLRESALGAQGSATSHPPELSALVAEGVAPLTAFLGPGVSPLWSVRGLSAFGWLFGSVSLELFGQLTGAVAPALRTEVHDAEVDHIARWIGVAS